MNFYFVFEGKTEPIVYRNWISKILPHITEVDSYNSVYNNNYYYESDMGVPDCYNVIANAIQEINENPKYNFLVLFTDADRFTIEEKKEEAYKFIENKLNDPQKGYKYKSLPENCELLIIVQKVCIESWFLGNKKFFVRNPESKTLRDYIEYYNVSVNNPEEMANEFNQNEEGTAEIFGYPTKALFHEGYLREIFKERNAIRRAKKKPVKHLTYRKSKPMEVQEEYFLNQIISRIEENQDHLVSFQEFLNFCLKFR